MPMRVARRSSRFTATCAALLFAAGTSPAWAAPFFFSTGGVNGLLAAASRPDNGLGTTEIESADDFVLAAPTTITSATFTGLMPLTATPSFVGIEIYRVFPLDSNTARTPNVPTRTNSPSDVALASRDSGAGSLSFSTTVLNSVFTASNSIRNGINPSPNTITNGEGPVTGAEVQFNVTLTTPLDLASGHYFFVAQVGLPSAGDFYWLSASRPIVSPGTPFAPDLQSWIRNAALDPDWLRMGTDIIGGGTSFNMAFTLTGTVAAAALPEPPVTALLGLAFAGFALTRRRRRISRR